MKRIINKILLVIMSFCLLLVSLKVDINAQSLKTEFKTVSYEDFSVYTPLEADKAAINYYKDMAEYAKEYKEAFELEERDLDNICIGEPFCIFSEDIEKGNQIFYYPLMNSENTYVLLLTVIKTDYAWQCSLDNELVGVLNEINYYSEDYIFYQFEESIIIRGKENVYFIGSGNTYDPYDFMSYEEIHDILVKSISNLTQINVTQNINDFDISVLEGYTSAFSSVINDPELEEKILKLYNAKGQGNYLNCWAASVATVVNYIRGTNITAINVCNIMNKDYNLGGTIDDKQNALKKYGIEYNCKRMSSLTWSQVIQNISDKKPVAMSGKNVSEDGDTSWHAVTLVGYRSFKVNRYIAIWDSASNDGNGGFKIINFSSAYTTFQSFSTGPVYTWVRSLSAY